MNLRNLNAMTATLILASSFLTANLAHADAEVDRQVPYALTLSGGISLGAYESGVNWALLQHLRASRERANFGDRTTDTVPKLVTVTGASAGAINALVSAISWCIDQKKAEASPGMGELSNKVSQNLFYSTWVTVGLDELLPKARESYLDGDGVLTRRAFESVLDKIAVIIGLSSEEIRKYQLPLKPREEAGLSIFANDCKVRLGFTVTSERPHPKSIAGLSVSNQRHFIPLELAVEQNKLVFRNYEIDVNTPGLGNVIFLPTVPGKKKEIDKGAVLNAVLASAAFPVAFGRRMISYCRPSNNHQSEFPSGCDGRHLEEGVFIDGGVFDNVPLGATRALAEAGGSDSSRRISYVYIDPDNRRKHGHSSQPVDQKADDSTGTLRHYGLRSQLSFLPGSIESARNYELYKELSTGDWNSKVSDKLEELAAFLKRYRGYSGETPTTRKQVCERPRDIVTCQSFLRDDKFFEGKDLAPRLRTAEACLLEEVCKYEHALQMEPQSPKALKLQREALLRELRKTVAGLEGRPSRPNTNFEALRNSIERAIWDPMGDRQVFLSSRFHQITGEYLGGFGAFADQTFREFDYYVGVYDAIFGIAKNTCEVRNRLESDSNKPCNFAETLRDLYQLLEVNLDPLASHIFMKMLAMELEGQVTREHWQEFVGGPSKPDALKTAVLPLNGDEKKTTSGATADYDRLIRSLSCLEGERLRWCDSFKTFIKQLEVNSNAKGQDAITRDASAPSIDVKRWSGNGWWLNSAARIAQRLGDLETTEPQGKENWSKEFGLTAKLMEAEARGNLWSVLGIHNDSRLATEGTLSQLASPYEIGMRTGRDPVPFMGWQWGLDAEHINLPVEVHAKIYCGGGTCNRDEVPWMTQVGAGAWARLDGMKFGVRVPDVNYLWTSSDYGRRTGWGWSAYGEWQCFQATLGNRAIGQVLVKQPSDYYVDLSFVFREKCWTWGNQQ